jgi:hypothetical protein
MRVATGSTATPRAHANLLKMFKSPAFLPHLLLSRVETCIISQPALHLLIEQVVIYFRGVVTTELL